MPEQPQIKKSGFDAAKFLSLMSDSTTNSDTVAKKMSTDFDEEYLKQESKKDKKIVSIKPIGELNVYHEEPISWAPDQYGIMFKEQEVKEIIKPFYDVEQFKAPDKNLSSMSGVKNALNEFASGAIKIGTKIPFYAAKIVDAIADIPQQLSEYGERLAGGNIDIKEAKRNKKRLDMDLKLLKTSLAVDKFIDQYIPTSTLRKGDFLSSELPGATGTLAGFATIGVLTGGSAFATGLAGALSEAQVGLENTYLATSDINKANMASVGYLAAGATEAIGLEGIFRNAVKLRSLFKSTKVDDLARGIYRTSAGKAAWEATKAFTSSGLEEGSQEMLQQTMENLTDQQVYDATREWSEGVLKGGLIGFITGGVFAGLISTINHRTQQRFEDEYLKEKYPSRYSETTLGRVQPVGQVELVSKQSSDVLQKARAIVENTIQAIENNSTPEGEISQTFDNAITFGNKGSEIKVESSKNHSNGLDKIVRDSDNNINKLNQTIATIPEANLIDHVVHFGKNQYQSYIKGINEEELTTTYIPKNIVKDSFYKLTNNEIHTASNDAYIKTKTKALELGIDKELNLSKETIGQDLYNDVVVATALNFGKDGLKVLRNKWATIPDDVFNNIANKIITATKNINPLVFAKIKHETAKSFKVLQPLIQEKTDAKIIEGVLSVKPQEMPRRQEALNSIFEISDLSENPITIESNPVRQLANKIASGNKEFTEEELQLQANEATALEIELNAIKNNQEFNNLEFTYPSDQNQQEPSENTKYSTSAIANTANNVKDLFTVLKINDTIDKETLPLEKIIVPFIGDQKVIWAIPSDNKGKVRSALWRRVRDAEGNLHRELVIHPNLPIKTGAELYNIIMHESIHGYISEYMEEDNPTASLLKEKMSQLMTFTQHAITNPYITLNSRTVIQNSASEQELKKQREYLNKNFNNFENVHEFLANALSNDKELRDILLKITIGGENEPKKSVWQSIKDWIMNLLFKSKGKSSPKQSVYNAIIKLLDDFTDNISSFHLERQGISDISVLQKIQESYISNMTENGDDKLQIANEDLLDIGQTEDSESTDKQDIKSLKSFSKILADLRGESIHDHYDFIKKLDYDSFSQLIEDLDLKSEGLLNRKLKELHQLYYKPYINDFQTFKKRFITRNLLLGTQLKKQNFVNIEFRKLAFTDEVVPFIKHLPAYFETPEHSKSDTYDVPRVIDTLLPKLSELLGGDLEIAYVNGFESQEVDEYGEVKSKEFVNLNNLNKKHLGQDPFSEVSLSSLISDAIYKAGTSQGSTYLYMGNFSGKNTIPLLQTNNITGVISKLKEYRDYYNSLGIEYMPSSSDYSGVLRQLVTDLWYGVEFNEAGLPVKPNIKDFNNTQKRSTALLAAIDPQVYSIKQVEKQIADEKPFGIYVDKGQVRTRGIILSSDIDKQQGDIQLENGEIVTVSNLQKVLRSFLNDKEFKESTGDGATYYIIGEFDEYYRQDKGAYKSGAIKNLVASRYGEKPLFIKHAMHGVPAESTFGQWMKKFNLSWITFDASAKIGADSYGKIDIRQLYGNIIPEENVIDIPLSYFSRIKEEQNLDRFKGAVKQLINGTGVGNFNPAIDKVDPKGEFTNILSRVFSNVINNTENYYNMPKQDMEKELLKIFKQMILESNSPQEQQISNVFSRYLTIFQDDADFTKFASKLFNFGYISEGLRNRLSSRLSDTVQMKLPGYRAALGPNHGAFNAPAQVEPIIARRNLAQLLLNMGDEDLLKEAFDTEVLEDVKTLFKTQRLQTNAYNKRDKETEEQASKTIAEIKKRLKDVPITSLVNWESSAVKKWVEKTTNNILDQDTKRIKNGYALITQDDANKFGLKPGDKVVMVVTPTDAPSAVSVQTVAAILPVYGANKVSDNNKVVLSAEYIQSVVGKDFDIDTISVIPYDSDYWSREDYDKFTSILDEASKYYTDEIVKSFKSALRTQEINKTNIFDEDLRLAYCQRMLKKKEGAKDEFAPFGNDFHYINDAYLFSKAPVFSLRLLHTELSAINFKVPGLKLGKNLNQAMDLEVNHPHWSVANTLFLEMTHDAVDYPKTTARDKYNSNFISTDFQRKMFQIFYNITDSEMYNQVGDKVYQNIPYYQIKLINGINKNIFSSSFNLARLLDPLTRETLDYQGLREAISNQKSVLKALINNDIEALMLRIEPLLQDIALKNPADVEKAKTIARTYLSNLELGWNNESREVALRRFPLFQIILDLNVDSYPMPGSTFDQYLTDQALAVKDVLSIYPELQQIYDKWIVEEARGGGPKAKSFLRQNQVPYSIISYGEVKAPVDNIAIAMNFITRELSVAKKNDLDILKREVISLLRTTNEIQGSLNEIGREGQSNMEARKATFPLLFNLLLHQPNIIFNKRNASPISINYKGNIIKLIPTTVGELKIEYKDKTYSHRDLPNNSDAKEVYNALTNTGGVWDSATNRQSLGVLLDLQANLPVEERRDLTIDYIKKNLYSSKKYDALDVKAFWLSVLAQPSNEAVQENRALGLLVNKQIVENPATNLEYQSSLPVLELMTFLRENDLIDTYLQAYTERNSQSMIDGIGWRSYQPKKQLIWYYSDKDDVNPNTDPYADFREGIKTYIENFKANKGFFDSDYRSFKKILEKEGYEAGFKKLRELASDINTMQAFAEHGLDFRSIVEDVNKLSAAAFKRKYENKNITDIDKTFGELEALAENRLSNEPSIKDDRVLRSLYWQWNGIKKLELSSPEEYSKLKDSLLNLTSYPLYGLMYEKKPYIYADKDDILTHVFSLNPGAKSEFDIINTKGVNHRFISNFYRQQPTHTNVEIGDSGIAVAKSMSIDLAMKYAQVKAGEILQDADDLIHLISNPISLENAQNTQAKTRRGLFINKAYSDIKEGQIAHSEQDKAGIHNKVFRIAENMLRDRGIYIANDGSNLFYVANGNTYSNPYDLIENEPLKLALDRPARLLKGQEKLAMLAALEYRKFYDVNMPILVKASAEYLQETFTQLYFAKDYVNARLVSQMIQNKQRVLDAINTQAGNYMPHQWPIAEYKRNWIAEKNRTYRLALLQEIKRNKDNKYDGLDIETPQGKQRFNEILQKRLEAQWNLLKIDAAPDYIIPNFLERKLVDFVGYDTMNKIAHINYLNNVIKGLTNDLKIADWFSYLSNARRHGETLAMINTTRKWYQDQVANKLLHTKPIEIKDLKPGMTINFNTKMANILPGNTLNELSTWGVVKEFIKDRKGNIVELQLEVDEAETLFKIDKALQKAKNEFEIIQNLPEHLAPTPQQLDQINTLLEKGYLKSIAKEDILKLNAKGASEYILEGLKALYADPRRVGRYKIEDIYTLDLLGKEVNTVNRFQHRGALEFLDTKAREYDAVRLMGGNDIDAAKYYAYKYTSNGIYYPLRTLKTLQALAYLGFVQGMKAKLTNWLGAYTSNVSNAPLHFSPLASLVKKLGLKESKDYYKIANDTWDRIANRDRESLTDEEMILFDIMTSLGYTDRGLVSISLSSANITEESLLSNSGLSEATKDTFRKWLDASGYKKYREAYDKLYEKYLTSNSEEAKKVWIEIKALQDNWNLQKHKVEGLNLSDTSGKTQSMLAKTLAKGLWSSFIRGKLGVGLQATAEKLRRPAFLMSYYEALDNGYSLEEAIIIAINSVEAKHAFYGPANKQFLSNTKAGSFFMQFAQYSWNSFVRVYKEINESIPQLIRHKSKDWNQLNLWANRYIKYKDEVKTGNITKEISMKDINVAHSLLVRTLIGLSILQASNILVGGRFAANSVDPMIQLVYNGMISLLEFLDSPDDWDGKEQAKYMLRDLLFFIGAPTKTLSNIPFVEPKGDQSFAEAWLMGGRVYGQSKFIQDLVDIYEGTDPDTQMNYSKNSSFTAKVLGNFVASDILGVPMFKPQYIGKDDKSFIGKNILGQRDVVTISKNKRSTIKSPDNYMYTPDVLRLALDPRTYMPFSDYLFKINL